MSVIRRLAGALRPSRDDHEAARIRVYEATQRAICSTAEAMFDPPDYRKLAALASSVLAGHRPVRGIRHAGDTVEWWIVAEDQERPAVDDMSLEHLHHLATVREDLVMYLALPVGWSFVLLADDARTWAAFSPAERLQSHVEDFLDDPSAHEAEASRTSSTSPSRTMTSHGSCPPGWATTSREAST